MLVGGEASVSLGHASSIHVFPAVVWERVRTAAGRALGRDAGWWAAQRSFVVEAQSTDPRNTSVVLVGGV
jgi:hypothetical protein